jgi:hypothetical protein
LISLIPPLALSGNDSARWEFSMEAKNVEGVDSESEEKDNVLFQVDGYTASVKNLKYES